MEIVETIILSPSYSTISITNDQHHKEMIVQDKMTLLTHPRNIIAATFPPGYDAKL